MLNTPFSPWPSFTEDEVQAVAAVLTSNKVNYWTGQECRQFEKEFAAWSGSEYAVAVSNGTLALDLALHGLGIGAANGGSADDEVVVTPRTFIASISCVVNAGARPVFADVDSDSANITAGTIARVLTPRTKAVIPVHLAGWPCDMDPIMALAEKHGLKVIEDCAQAHGARYKGKPAGSIGHVGAWSFCQDKIMTTGGEGGMVTTSDKAMWARMWAFKDHGKSYEAVYERQHPPGFRWLHESFGTNWRMLEMQAVIGRKQLQRMPEWTAARTANAARISAALQPYTGKGGMVRLPRFDGGNGSIHANYKYYAYIRPENLMSNWSRDRIVAEISKRGVPAFQGSCSEVYLEKAFDGRGLRPEKPLPVAHELGAASLMLLVHPTLKAEEMSRTAEVLDEVFRLAAANAA